MHDNETHKAEDSPARGSGRGWMFWVWLAVLFLVALGAGRWWASTPKGGPEAPLESAPTVPAVPAPEPRRAVAEIQIAGRVLGAAGAPLQGAAITATTDGRSEPLTTTTNASGDWSLNLGASSARSLWQLKFDAKDHVSEQLSGYSPTAEAITVELQSGGGVSGRVTVDGEGQTGAQIRLAGPGLWPPVDVVTGEDGGFVTPPIPEGRYQLLARTLTHGAIATVDHEVRPDAEPIEIPLLAAGTLSVSVQGPPHALVTLAEDRVHVLSLAQWTQNQTAVFTGLPPGEWAIRVRAPGFQEKVQIVRTQAAAAEIVVNPAPAGTLRGRVSNSAGKPLELVQLVAHTTTAGGGQWLLRRDPTGSIQSRGTPQGGGTPSAAAAFGWFSDEVGRFELTGLPAGTVVLEARQPGYQPAFAGPYRVDDGGVVENIELVLTPGLELTVRVEGPAGPLAVARVELAAADAPVGDRNLPAAFAGNTRELVTGEDGTASAQGLPARVRVRAWADGYVESSQTVDIPALRGEPLVLRLEAPGATTRGRVSLEGELPLGGVDVHRIAALGQPVSVTACRATTDDNGRFELVGCPEGEIWLAAVPPPDRGAPSVTKTTSGEDTELTVGTPATVTIRVLNSDGSPIDRAQIHVLTKSKAPAWQRRPLEHSGHADENGVARFVGVTRTSMSIRVQARGYQSVQRPLAVGGDSELSVTLRPTIQLVGNVVDRYGAPVSGARVRVGGFTTSSGERGDFEVELGQEKPVTVVAIHTVLGRGQARWQPGAEPVRVELDSDTIDVEQWRDSLEAAGATLWIDNARVVVEDVDEAAHAAGARRGDVLIGVTRKGEKLRVEVDRNGKTVRYDL